MSLDDPVVITCSISGALANREQCPAIPYTPEEYAAEARRIVDEGGVQIHIHARTARRHAELRGRGLPRDHRRDPRPRSATLDRQLLDRRDRRAASRSASPTCASCRPEVAALNMGSMNYAKYSRAAQGVRLQGRVRQPVRRDHRAARGDERARDQARARVLRRRPRRLAGAAGRHGRAAPAAARRLRHGRHRRRAADRAQPRRDGRQRAPRARTGA